MNRELKVEKILTTVALIFIALSLCVIALTPPATGYEISVYDAYPTYFWFFIVGPITCGIFILLHQSLTEKKSRWWLAGLMIIIFANTVFLLLPLFRGYALYGRGGDTLTHLGYIKDILATGHIGESNFYPIIHVLGTSLIQVAGLSLENIPFLFFVLFSGIYIVNMYLLAISVSNDSGLIPLIVAFASPLIYSVFHANIHPSFLSLFMVPYLLYFYQEKEKFPHSQRQKTTLLLLLAFSITFWHPVTALFVIVLFLTTGLAHSLYSRFLRREMHKLDQIRIGKNFLEVSLITLISFFIWYFSYSYIHYSFKTVYDWLVYQIGTPLIQATLDPLAQAGLTPLQTFELFMNRYGAVFLLLLISTISCISVLSKSLSRKGYVNPMKFAYATSFLAALFIGAVMLFGYFVEYGLVRVVRLPLLIGTILCGLVIYDFINRGSKKNATKMNASAHRPVFMMAIALVIIVMVALSLGSVYGSPRVYQTNDQVTRMDIAGTKWLGRSKDPDIALVANSPIYMLRLEDYIFGVESSPVIRSETERLPSHFGYDEHDQIAETFDFQDRYLVIFELDKVVPLIFPENVRPRVHQYTEEDFAKLNSDPTIAKLYCNGEFEVWKICGREND